MTTLDSLLSPQAAKTTFALQPPPAARESTASDYELDDEQFSPIALTSGMNAEDTPSESTQNNSDTPPPTRERSASTATVNGVPFILARLDEAGKRVSVDGQHQLQDRFAARKEQERDDDAATAAIDWDFWGAVISDYQLFASEHPEELAQAIARGIPGTLRGMLWQLMAASKDPELEQTYLRLLKQSSSHEKSITRDLGRTFPHHDYFTNGQGIGQENLFNVLKAYSLYDEAVGYCQGLPFVVAILLLNMPDEEAFSLLVRLMHVYDLRGHFMPEMPGMLTTPSVSFPHIPIQALQLRLFQFDRLVEELLPVLHVHFLRQGVKSSMYTSQWFLTLFSYRFPLDIVYRIYDNCLASGIEAIFGFSIMLLMKNEDVLLTLKFDQILEFLNNRLFDRYKASFAAIRSVVARLTLVQVEPEEGADAEVRYRVDEFVQDAVSLAITPFMLDGYRHEYEEMVREKNKHASEMDELRNSNRVLSSSVKTLESSLAQLNTEHVNVLNELVQSRLRNEELEGELVKYKLLYAEAAHESQIQDASSQRSSFASLLTFRRNG
ncbi:ABC1-domain-containing protein [Mycena kentingensis (nom. inval.)]|nr:ABC1-domain-containing protein [Mycena kentingensis (nom. inval.)]